MIDIEVPEDIKVFVKDIQDRVKDDFKVYIGGGFCRDLYCDKTIKDLDLFFIPCKGVTREIGYVPAKCYINYNKRVGNLTNTSYMAERGVSQVIGLFNSNLSTPEVQFIVYEKYLSMQELANDFDMGIAQVVWSPIDESIYVTEAFLHGHSRGIIKCLHDYDKIRTYDRYCRMEAKFPEYHVVGKPSTSVLPFEDILAVSMGIYKPRSDSGSFIGDGNA